MAPKPPPSRRDADSEVSFNWPGQQRKRRDQGTLETRLAARRASQQAQAQTKTEEREAPAAPAPEREPSSRGANLPARRQQLAAGASERWIVTELRRQSITTESALREINERIDQLGRTLRQVVDFLPQLQQRTVGGGPASGAAGRHADAVVSQRIDELEARLEARFDELTGAAAALRGARGAAAARSAPAAVGTAASKAQVHEAMGEGITQLADMGD